MIDGQIEKLVLEAGTHFTAIPGHVGMRTGQAWRIKGSEWALNTHALESLVAKGALEEKNIKAETEKKKASKKDKK